MQHSFRSVLLLVFVSLTNLWAFNKDTLIIQVKEIDWSTNFFGVWNCKVTGAAPEYQNSILFVTENEHGLPSVVVQLESGTLSGQQVLIDENILRFDINLEGIERVSIVLEPVKDQLRGKVSTSGGELPVICTRKLPPKKF